LKVADGVVGSGLQLLTPPTHCALEERLTIQVRDKIVKIFFMVYFYLRFKATLF